MRRWTERDSLFLRDLHFLQQSRQRRGRWAVSPTMHTPQIKNAITPSIIAASRGASAATRESLRVLGRSPGIAPLVLERWHAATYQPCKKKVLGQTTRGTRHKMARATYDGGPGVFAASFNASLAALSSSSTLGPCSCPARSAYDAGGQQCQTLGTAAQVLHLSISTKAPGFRPMAAARTAVATPSKPTWCRVTSGRPQLPSVQPTMSNSQANGLDPGKAKQLYR
eukprot:scaffold458_cov206-Pinguiococcus_pyrenoidosus.AAC.2